MYNKDLLRALYPLYFTHFVMGYSPILIKNEKKETITRKLYNGSSFIIIFILMMVYLSFKDRQMPSLNSEEDTLMKFINLMYFTIVLGFPIISLLWTKLQKKSVLKVWKRFSKIVQDSNSLNINLNYSQISRSSIRYILFSLIFFNAYFIYVVINQEISNTVQATTSYGLLYFGVLNHTAALCTFLTLFRFVSHIFEKLVEKIEFVLAFPQENCSFVLKKLMCVYDDLLGLSKLVNRVFSVQLLLSFAISFVLLTFQAYNVACSIYNGSPYLRYAVAAVMFVLTGILEKFVVAMSCHRCMKRNETLKFMLNKFMAVYSTDRKIKKELNAFSLQLLHEKFEIYAGNMFLIDLPIFTSVCGTATTYIILLWQTDTGVDLNYSMKKVFGVL